MNMTRISLILTMVLAVSGWMRPVPAQEYVLDKGDLITVTFWQQPDLNTQARIDAEGKIDLPLAGRIQAAGVTVEQLSRRIVEKLSIYNSTITQAAVTVNEYGSRKIFVTGAVGAPGKYAFEKIPGIWEVILEAGGPLPNAKLDQVQIVRGGATGQVMTVDLTAAFTGGDMSNLPKLQPGDNINVPGAAGPPAAGSPLQGSLVNQQNAIYVFGYVAAPGIYHLDKDMDVLQAIVQAGGPLIYQGGGGGGGRPMREPDLRNVKIISRGPEAPVVYSVDLESYTKQAAPWMLPLRPGDTVYIPGKENYGRFILGTTITEVAKSAIAIITSYILLDRVFNVGGR